MNIIFIVHFDEFYTALFSHKTCILSSYKKKKNMAKKSAESYVSLKALVTDSIV